MKSLIRIFGPAWVFAVALLAGGCLKDHPLILPDNGYDPAYSLRNDSLTRFDTVAIYLVDGADTLLIWNGPLQSTDQLEPRAAGDGRTAFYLVRGSVAQRGQCFTAHFDRSGKVTVMSDTCRPVSVPNVVVEKPGTIPPRFDRTVSSDAGTDSLLRIRVLPFSGPDRADLKVLSYGDTVGGSWVGGLPIRIDTSGTLIPLPILRDPLHPKIFTADLEVSSPHGKDTLSVRMTVLPPPTGLMRGRAVDRKSGQPSPGWTVKLVTTGESRVTSTEGHFDFGARAPGRYPLEISGDGRIGRNDTLTVAANDTAARDFLVQTPAVFQEAHLTWMRRPLRVAVAAGHALIPSDEFDSPGAVAIFPLDNASASLQKFPGMANWRGNPPEEYFEPGEFAADSQAFYSAYPEQDRVGRVGNWLGTVRALNVKLPFQPGGLLRDGRVLWVMGRITDGTMVLAELDTADLALRRVDTLVGQGWDAALPLERVPRLVATPAALFAVDGNGTSAKGRLLRIDRSTRKVDAWVELPEAGAADVAAGDGLLYVAVSAASSRQVLVYDQDLQPRAPIELGRPSHRVAVADRGSLAGLILVAAEDNAVWVLRPGESKPAGRLPLPGSLRAKSLAVDRAGRIVATDGAKVYKAEY